MIDSRYKEPPHYTAGGIECIDYMRSVMTAEEFKGYLWGNIIKYNHRWQNKGGTDDLQKLQVYASYLQEHQNNLEQKDLFHDTTI